MKHIKIEIEPKKSELDGLPTHVLNEVVTKINALMDARQMTAKEIDDKLADKLADSMELGELVKGLIKQMVPKIVKDMTGKPLDLDLYAAMLLNLGLSCLAREEITKVMNDAIAAHKGHKHRFEVDLNRLPGLN